MSEVLEIGKIVNTIGFDIDQKSWKNLDEFKNRFEAIKGLMASVADMSFSTMPKMEASKRLINEKDLNSKMELIREKARLDAEKKEMAHKMDMAKLERKAAIDQQKAKDRTERAAQATKEKTESAQRKAAEAEWKKGRKKKEAWRDRQYREGVKLNKKLEQQEIARAKKVETEKRKLAEKKARKVEVATIKFNNVASSSSRLKPEDVAIFRREFDALSETYVDTAQATTLFNAHFETLMSDMKRANKNVTSYSGKLKSLRSNIVALTAAYSAFSIASAVEGTGQEFQTLDAALTATFGSSSKAADEMKYLLEQTKLYGTDLDASARGYMQLSAAAKVSSMSQEQVRDLFASMSKVSTVFGMSVDDTTGSIRALVQMINKGTVTAEELKSQFAERVPGAIGMAAKAMGFGATEEGIDKLASAMRRGEIKAAQFLPVFSKVLGEFADAGLDKAMDANRVSMNRMITSFMEFKNAVFEGGFGDATKAVYGTVTDLLDALRPAASFISGVFARSFLYLSALIRVPVALLADLVRLIGKLTGESEILSFFGTWTQRIMAFILAFMAFKKITGILGGVFGEIKKVFSLISSARAIGILSRLRLAFMGALGPIGWAIAGISTALILLWENWDWVTKKFEESKEWFSGLFNAGDAKAVAGESRRSQRERLLNPQTPPVNVVVKTDGSKLGEAIKVEVHKVDARGRRSLESQTIE